VLEVINKKNQQVEDVFSLHANVPAERDERCNSLPPRALHDLKARHEKCKSKDRARSARHRAARDRLDAGIVRHQRGEEPSSRGANEDGEENAEQRVGADAEPRGGARAACCGGAAPHRALALA
jgi:hypothetical protein